MSDESTHVRSDDIAADLVEYLVLVVPDLSSLEGVVPALVELVRSGVVGILDVVVVTRDRAGSVAVHELEELESLAALAQVDGELGRLLSENDIELASLAVGPGMTGVVLVTEDRWARPLSAAARRAGGQIVAGERIPAARVRSVLAEGARDADEGS